MEFDCSNLLCYDKYFPLNFKGSCKSGMFCFISYIVWINKHCAIMQIQIADY